MQTFVGIDFSLTSPSMAILKDNKLELISFFNDYGEDWINGKTKKFKNHRELGCDNIITLIPYTRPDLKVDYQKEQQLKLEDARKIADLIISKIPQIPDIKIGLEGFSFASKGQSQIDLIMYQTILRLKIMEKFGEESLVIISPTEGKKTFSGKGNANKETMIFAFTQNKINSEEIPQTPLYKYLTTHLLDFKNIKPIDDIVDSCGILYATKKKTCFTQE